MARTIQVGLVAWLCCAGLGGAAENAPALVRYSFDDSLIDTGPDTFSIFQAGRGSVALSTAHRYSGYRSVELRDVPGDRSFPELQGYFPVRTQGKLYLHFALMTTDPDEELNIALAGPQWFTLRKDGIAFWLKTTDGYLTAVSDSMPKKLVQLNALVWYVVDAVYDIDAGAYDLTVRQDGVEAPVFQTKAQINAPHQRGSRVDKFSFIGDHQTDESNVVYYVDDVLVGVDSAIVEPAAFAAPGRRKLFVDYWHEAQRRRATRPEPLPLLSLADLGIGPEETQALREDGVGEWLGQVLAGSGALPPPERDLAARSRAVLGAVGAWREGVAALHGGDASLALERFEQAAQLAPRAPLFPMNAVIALVHLKQWDEVDRRLAAITPLWRGDVRLPATLALIGLARGDYAATERALREGTESTGLLAEEYFLALLWKGDAAHASAFAQTMLARGNPAAQSWWRERLGDAAFLFGDTAGAREFYEASLAAHHQPRVVWLKLSDVYFRLGDAARERSYRERVFGGLRGR
ncbi:MAG: hypothetical protein IT162_22590 [Bryobacterales bacterium]|nr:hypothetical protein [Bryobacterales bacterium]